VIDASPIASGSHALEEAMVHAFETVGLSASSD